jgi:hypothetical protein
MDGDGVTNKKETGLTTSWVADAKNGVMQMKISNNTGHPLKNALIVADVDVNQEILNSTEAGTMVLAGGLSLLMGIDPESGQSLHVIIVNATPSTEAAQRLSKNGRSDRLWNCPSVLSVCSCRELNPRHYQSPAIL